MIFAILLAVSDLLRETIYLHFTPDLFKQILRPKPLSPLLSPSPLHLRIGSFGDRVCVGCAA